MILLGVKTMPPKYKEAVAARTVTVVLILNQFRTFLSVEIRTLTLQIVMFYPKRTYK